MYIKISNFKYFNNIKYRETLITKHEYIIRIEEIGNHITDHIVMLI